MSDYDANEFLSSNFLKKDTLRQTGPQTLQIKAVESVDGIAKNGKPPKQILQLTFTDDQKLGLGTQVNLKRCIEWFGMKTSGWIGKTVVAYYSPDVRGPGGQEGGIRLRLPDGVRSPVASVDFTSVLTTELDDDVKGGVA